MTGVEGLPSTGLPLVITIARPDPGDQSKLQTARAERTPGDVASEVRERMLVACRYGEVVVLQQGTKVEMYMTILAHSVLHPHAMTVSSWPWEPCRRMIGFRTVTRRSALSGASDARQRECLLKVRQ